MLHRRLLDDDAFGKKKIPYSDLICTSTLLEWYSKYISKLMTHWWWLKEGHKWHITGVGEALNEVAYGQGLVVTGRFFNQSSTQFTNFDDIDENSDQLSFFPQTLVAFKFKRGWDGRWKTISCTSSSFHFFLWVIIALLFLSLWSTLSSSSSLSFSCKTCLFVYTIPILLIGVQMYSAPLLLIGHPPSLPSCLQQPLPAQINILRWKQCWLPHLPHHKILCLQSSTSFERGVAIILSSSPPPWAPFPRGGAIFYHHIVAMIRDIPQYFMMLRMLLIKLSLQAWTWLPFCQ